MWHVHFKTKEEAGYYLKLICGMGYEATLQPEPSTYDFALVMSYETFVAVEHLWKK